jgi:hypothetical protein
MKNPPRSGSASGSFDGLASRRLELAVPSSFGRTRPTSLGCGGPVELVREQRGDEPVPSESQAIVGK